MVLSSVIAAYADYADNTSSSLRSSIGAPSPAGPVAINVGYVWMLCNCLMTASYVLAMRKRIKITNFKASLSLSVVLKRRF
jgi:GDP-mannose transporter